MQTLRQMVVNVAKGIAGIQYGARPVPVDGIDLDEVGEVSIDWFTAFFDSFRPELNDRENYLITSSPILSAIGAMGNTLLNTPAHSRPDLTRRMLGELKTVDWRKGAHWQGIAGRFSGKGIFTVSGTKQVGYAVYNVLADSRNPDYPTVRPPLNGSTPASIPDFQAPLSTSESPWGTVAAR